MKLKKFETKRLILRPLTLRDFEAWHDAFVNALPQKNKWDRGPMKPAKCSREIFLRHKGRMEDLAQTDDYYRLYAFDKSSGQIVGHIDFDVYVRSVHQFANFGYQIYNRHWRKGFGKEAASAGLRIGFQHLRLNRLEASINLDNRVSVKLAKSIGMRREGIKKRYWYEDGEWTDQIIYVANPEDIGLKTKRPYRGNKK